MILLRAYRFGDFVVFLLFSLYVRSTSRTFNASLPPPPNIFFNHFQNLAATVLSLPHRKPFNEENRFQEKFCNFREFSRETIRREILLVFGAFLLI